MSQSTKNELEKPKKDNGTKAIAARKTQLRTFLAGMSGEIGKVATKHLDAETLASLVYTEAARQPDILNCVAENPASVASTVMLAAQLGLDVSGPLGHFYLIPRRSKLDPRDKRRNAPKVWTLSYILGYKGLLELARRSGKIVRLNARPVYRDELPPKGSFHYSEEPPECRHVHSFGISRADEDLVAAYAVAILPGGERIQRILERDELDDRRGRAQSDRFWKRDYAAMATKSAVRALLNSGLVPLTPALSAALESERDPLPEVIDAEVRPARRAPQSGTAELRGVLGIDVVDAVEGPPPEEVEPAPQVADKSRPIDSEEGEILELESKLSSEALQAAAKAAGLNPDAELVGQGDALKKYRAELERLVGEVKS